MQTHPDPRGGGFLQRGTHSEPQNTKNKAMPTQYLNHWLSIPKPCTTNTHEEASEASSGYGVG
jgi:hypothetical protein